MGYHRQSLLNLQEAMKRTRRLCAIIVDTVGRELMVVRDSHVTIDEDGWPVHSHPVQISAGDKVRSPVSTVPKPLPPFSGPCRRRAIAYAGLLGRCLTAHIFGCTNIPFVVLGLGGSILAEVYCIGPGEIRMEQSGSCMSHVMVPEGTGGCLSSGGGGGRLPWACTPC